MTATNCWDAAIDTSKTHGGPGPSGLRVDAVYTKVDRCQCSAEGEGANHRKDNETNWDITRRAFCEDPRALPPLHAFTPPSCPGCKARYDERRWTWSAAARASNGGPG